MQRNSLDTMDVKFLKGVGPHRAEALSSVGVRTVKDLLFYFPRRYLDRSKILPASRAKEAALTNQEVTFVGKIESVKMVRTRKGGILSVHLKDSSGTIECIWFNGVKYFSKIFKEGNITAFSGRVSLYRGTPCLFHPDYDSLEEESERQLLNTGGIIPVYPSTENLRAVGLDSRGLRKTIFKVIQDIFNDNFYNFEVLADPLPRWIREEHNLIEINSAVRQIHFPKSESELEAAQKRFKFDEFFYIQVLLAIRRSAIKSSQSVVMTKHYNLTRRFVLEVIPFHLTNSQKRVLKEIVDDLKSGRPMMRLLQGDVGSGKTIVALITMLIAVENNCQAAFMAPTEILAQQHYRTMKLFLDRLQVRSTLLIGGQKIAERKAIYREIETGISKIVVGTHALIQERVKFHRLGLAVVDEQHRFGVVQRMMLQEKGRGNGAQQRVEPHLLVMTATPIPRTLALTIYGDLDVSVIREFPRGRRPVMTVLRSDSHRTKIYRFIRDQVVAGRQAYIVYPLIKETEKSDLKAASESFIRLRDEVFPDLKVGLIHGQMTEVEKDSVMIAFKENRISILVATTVIEVGIDVQNATVMVIEHAERFGLSQLHQLRGRIGRGPHQSYCILITNEKYISGENLQSHDEFVAHKRLQAMLQTNDGFKISEIDLELRGPGDFFGPKQSGTPDLHIANLITDKDILSASRKSAFALVANDPHLRNPVNEQIRSRLLSVYKDSLEFLKAN
ncbi:MAG: ATP-dependent DNA helicase RecG [Candidatus Kryptoniota bacterium]